MQVARRQLPLSQPHPFAGITRTGSDGRWRGAEAEATLSARLTRAPVLVSGAILPATGLRPGVAWPVAVRFTTARVDATYFMDDHAASLFSEVLVTL
jgi:hypothetical protein